MTSRDQAAALEAIPVADAGRARRECRAARHALAVALRGEVEIARQFARDAGSLTHDDTDRAIDARLDAEARLGEWSR